MLFRMAFCETFSRLGMYNADEVSGFECSIGGWFRNNLETSRRESVVLTEFNLNLRSPIVNKDIPGMDRADRDSR